MNVTTKEEAETLIDELIDQMHSLLEQVEALATEHNIMVDHPFREYGEAGSATFLTEETVKQYLVDRGFIYGENHEEQLEDYISMVDDRLPGWISSYGFE